MRRKRDDKRVLIPRNNYQSRQSVSRRRKRNNRNAISRGQPYNGRYKKRSKNSGMLVFIMIIALLGFIIGAGVGVSLNMDDASDHSEDTHVQNVTKEMTTNLTDDDKVYYDSSVDNVDYNENQTSGDNVSYV